MELSIQKIKKEIESKRKHNEEVLKLLKERSIIYNAEKERQKKYFLNTSSSLLSRKRKHSSDNDDNNKNEEISNDISNYEDYDEYIDDFNSSFFSNRTFTNLNFCRPERFSFSKNKNKKKLLIKNEEGFTIDKTIIQRPMKRYSNCSLTFSHTSNDKENGKSKEIKSSIGLFGSSADKTNLNSNQEKNSFFDIKDSANSTLIQEKKSEIKSGNSLFGDSTSLKINNNSSDNINNNNNANTKSLFSSNITGENKNEEKKTSSLFGDKKDNKLEQSTSLFGDLNRFNKNEEPKPLFSAPAANIPATSDKSKDNEKSKGLFSSPIKETKNKLTDNKNETPKKISLFGIKENEKEKDNKVDKETEKEKEKISIPNSLFGFVSKENKETKDNKENKENNKDTNKEKDNTKNITTGYSLFGFGGNKEEKKEEKKEETKEKEKINLFNIKPKEIEEKKEENEKPKETGGLFGNILNKEEKTKPNLSLFNSGAGSSLFGNQTPKHENEKKEAPGQGLFSSSGQVDNNKSTNSLFNSDFNKSNNENKSLFNNSQKPKEEIKFDSTISKGSLANESNPFLQQNKKNNVPVIFSANNLFSNNTSNNTPNLNTNGNNNNTFSLFNSGGNNTNNIFMNNNDKKVSFGFGASSSMDTENFEMSSENKSNLNPINNNNNSSMNIFGAPINSINNNSSIFKSSNNFFGSNSNGGGLFSNQKSTFAGNFNNIQFSMGK